MHDPAEPKATQVSSIKHVIFTRFGIGVQRAGFHERRLAIMKASLLPCIASQTYPNVHWLVVTDSRIPAQVRTSLEAIREQIPNFYLRTIDPLREYSLNGLKKEFVSEIVGDDQVVFLSRIDDDDAISRRFSEIIAGFLSLRIAEGVPLPIAGSWTQGLDIYVGESKGGPTKMPWHAPTIGVATRLDKFFNPMGTHWTVGTRATAAGGTAFEIDDQEPIWAWLRHKGSDSSEFRNIARAARELPSSDALLTSAFQLSLADLADAQSSPQPDPSFKLELVDGQRGAKTRLELKHHVLGALALVDGALKEAEAKADQRALRSLTASRLTLASLFYSI